MSHLTTKIYSEVPNINGEYPSVNIQDLSDYPAGITDGQTLIYNSTTGSFEGGAVVNGTAVPCAVFGRREADDYANSGRTFTAGQRISLYDTNPINNIPEYVTFNYIAGTNWLDTITLQPGKYELFASIACIFSTLGYVAYSWQTTAGARRSAWGVIGETTTYPGANTQCLGAVVLTSATNMMLDIEAASGASTSQGTFPSQRSFISIRKML